MDALTPIFLKSELNLFTESPIQLGVEASNFIEIFPITSLNENSPIEFFLNGSGDSYLDFGYTILHLQIQILKKAAGAKIAESDVVSPINYVLNSMFSELSLFLNDKQVSSQTNYAYRALLESLLFSSKSTQTSLLTSGLYYRDSPGLHEDIATGSTNEGFVQRRKMFKLSKLVDWPDLSILT